MLLLCFIGASFLVDFYQATDGGTIVLDWLMHYDVVEDISQVVNGSNPGTDRTPIAIVVLGLTSDSSAAVSKGRMECCCAKPSWTWRDIFNREFPCIDIEF
ncbi:PREDICTED: uncharacterized protein LOC109128757 [Camelina sativa]|uniref:Uncharacterized protein LOC109128757 n=1 Tax=Camelina sativa TaxID=90675 RepID=A0ABM1QWU3_CAMSA|nr:PREDICTED: uncharacterized protein LOC109128757 [Camelina sativa]